MWTATIEEAKQIWKCNVKSWRIYECRTGVVLAATWCKEDAPEMNNHTDYIWFCVYSFVGQINYRCANLEVWQNRILIMNKLVWSLSTLSSVWNPGDFWCANTALNMPSFLDFLGFPHLTLGSHCTVFFNTLSLLILWTCLLY